MRVSAGTLKGRRICSGRLPGSSGSCLRPTSSKVREAIFDIVRDKISGAAFADLYAGTGAVGFEAMSRGADKVFFVDADKRKTVQLKSLLTGCRCFPKTNIINRDAAGFIREAAVKGMKFDILFLDPPYHTEEIERILPAIGNGDVLYDKGVVIVEHFSKKTMVDKAGKLEKKKTYRYGDTMLTLYQLQKQA